MKKLQIFVSSTYDDLQNEREKVVQGILDAEHIPAGMELFGGAGTVIDTIKKWIDASDIFMLLLGGKYGSIYEEEGISYTEWEYNYAKLIEKPICIIKLSKGMIYRKAAEQGENQVLETEHKELYESFLKNVGAEVYKEVSEISEIPGVVQSHITKVINHHKDRLVGWVRGDSIITSWDDVTDEKVYEQYKQIINSIVSRNYSNTDMLDFSNDVGQDMLSAIKARGILNLFHRVVRFNRCSDDLVKVCIYDQYNYRYLKSECPAFGKKFQATEQQAETYQVDKLLINNVDYTDSFEMNITPEHSRGQLEYYVQSKKSIPMGSEYPIEIHYKSSYISPILDFFQVYGLPFPCKNFYVELYLEDGLEKEYSIITSTNSSFSKEISDSFKANEMKNFGECRIQFPEWSLAGTGYVATIKRKTQANH